MWSIILANAGLWLNLLIPFGFAAYLLIAHREYILKEFGIQMAATLTFLVIAYGSLFSLTTDLIDSEQHNGYISSAAYYEGYEYEYDCSYESCTGSGKNETCVTIPQTCEDWHPDEWESYTSNGEIIRISQNQYRNYSRLFGHKEVQLKHYDQTYSSKRKDEGDKWVSYPNITIPSAVTHSYENYVVAANHNVINVKTSQEEIKFLVKNGSLKPYPGKYKDKFGTPKQSRIINTTSISNSKMLKDLDLLASKLGRSKQVNPIIYITNEDRSFKYILEAYWKGGKKNDAILVLGTDDSGTVQWSDIIAWTDNTDIFIDAQSDFDGKKITEVVPEFGKLLQQYKRKPMKDFEYLKENITLDFKWQALIFILNLIGSFFLFRFMLKN